MKKPILLATLIVFAYQLAPAQFDQHQQDKEQQFLYESEFRRYQALREATLLTAADENIDAT
jgi:hypothetical protein